MHREEWQKVKEVLWLALEQPVGLREEFLQKACGDNAELRDEVKSLLEAGEGSNLLLENENYNLASVFNENEKNYEEKIFGHYRIIREIGRGGMGAVFLAERADGEFKQKVALKIIRQSFADADLEKRFRREREILASLNHPNIAVLHDGGVSERGELFLVMEFIEGQPLLEFVENLNINEKLRLFLKICSAVAYAHQNSIVHRDIKPSNILVKKDGEPKLLDFGLAKIYGKSFLETSQTETAFRAFTPSYASPEQIHGKNITTASDIYSLGVILYELLTGQNPFHFENKSFEEILKTIDYAEPARPSSVSSSNFKLQTSRLEESRTNSKFKIQNSKLLKGDLDNITLKALRKEPERRYKSVEEFALDIEKHLKRLPISARPNTASYRASKLFQRNRISITSAVFVVLAVILCAVTLSTVYFNSQVPTVPENVSGNSPVAVKTIAVLPLKSLSNPPGDQELRVGMADSIVTKLGTVKQIAVRPTSSTTQYLDQNYNVQKVGNELKVDSVLEGSLQKEGQNLRINLQMVNVSDGKIIWSEGFTSNLSSVLSGQESIANRVSRLMTLNTNPVSTDTTSSNLLAQDAFLKGNYALNTANRKIENIFAARDYFERAIRLDENFALAHSGLAMTYTLAGSLTLLSPQESYPSAEKAARRALEIDPDSAAAYVVLGEVESDYNWNWTAADANFQRALELAPNLAVAHHGYNEFLARQGRFEEAGYHSDVAQQLDPTRVNYVALRALHYIYERRFDDAVTQSRTAIERSKNTYLAYLYLNTAENLRGNYSAAEQAGLEATAISGGGAADLFVLGNTYALMKDERRTNEILEKMTAMSKTRYVDPIHFVVIHGYRGDKDKAFVYLEKCFREKSYWMTALNVNPVFDTLRSDERFSEMLKKMNLN